MIGSFFDQISSRTLTLMTSPPSLFAVSPAAAAANLSDDPDLTIVGFLKSPDSLPLYLLIAMIVYIVQLRYCNCRFKQKTKPWRRRFWSLSRNWHSHRNVVWGYAVVDVWYVLRITWLVTLWECCHIVDMSSTLFASTSGFS